MARAGKVQMNLLCDKFIECAHLMMIEFTEILDLQPFVFMRFHEIIVTDHTILIT